MLTIRKGNKEDLPGALKLIHELAEYEKAPDEVVNTLEMMQEDGFGEHPVFEFLVATDIGKIVGIAIYYYSYSTWKGKCIHLEDLVVTLPRRGQGIGKKLFEEMIGIARTENVGRLTWQVLDWNEPALNFYKKYNPVMDREWIDCKFTKEHLQSVDI